MGRSGYDLTHAAPGSHAAALRGRRLRQDGPPPRTTTPVNRMRINDDQDPNRTPRASQQGVLARTNPVDCPMASGSPGFGQQSTADTESQYDIGLPGANVHQNPNSLNLTGAAAAIGGQRSMFGHANVYGSGAPHGYPVTEGQVNPLWLTDPNLSTVPGGNAPPHLYSAPLQGCPTPHGNQVPQSYDLPHRGQNTTISQPLDSFMGCPNHPTSEQRQGLDTKNTQLSDSSNNSFANMSATGGAHSAYPDPEKFAHHTTISQSENGKPFMALATADKDTEMTDFPE